MGVLPLQFKDGDDRKTLGLTGKEILAIRGLDGAVLRPQMDLRLEITREDGSKDEAQLLCRIDTSNEVEYFKAGGILHYVLRQLLAG
ncbi:Aconitate hydratase A [compost metagenome]